MEKLRILMLEDNSLDAIVISKQLEKLELPYELTVVNTGIDYLEKLKQPWDVILCDHQLPDFDSIRALKVKNQLQDNIPFILITGAVPENEAVDLVREGADDYILKDRLPRLVLAIQKALDSRTSASIKKSTEASLSNLSLRFQLAAKASFDVIWDYDLERDMVYCSEAIEKVLCVPYQEYYKPEYLKQFIYEEDLDALEKSFAWLLAGSEHKWRKIFRIRRKDGSVGWINSNALVIRDRNDKVCRIAGVMQDVTEIHRLQHELMEQEQLKQKEIAEISLASQEKERQEIGRELHDNVNQLLATAKIMIDTAKSIPDMHDLCLAKSQENIMEAIKEIRNIAHSMMPPDFEKYQFENIILNLVQNINLTGINAELELPDPAFLQMINSKLKLSIYRIIQEQVSNILKYAKANNITISLQRQDQHLLVAIEDDGIGYDHKKLHKGIGFRNMESRVGLFGGSLKIISSPGEGCLVRVQIPIHNGANRKEQDKISSDIVE